MQRADVRGIPNKKKQNGNRRKKKGGKSVRTMILSFDILSKITWKIIIISELHCQL